MKGILYVGEQPIDVSQCSSLESEEVSDATHEFPQSFSFSAVFAYPKRVHRFFKERTRLHNRLMKELALIKANRKHFKVVVRCIHYGNRVPRKYRRLYKELIKSMLRGKKDSASYQV